MQSLNCPNCGVSFLLNDDFYNRRKEDGKTFHCPNGHPQVFRVSDNQELKQQISNLKEKFNRIERDLERYKTMHRNNIAEIEQLNRALAIQKRRATYYKNKNERLSK